MDAGGRRFALLVNPSAGGARATRALPGVMAALHELGLPFRTVKTKSMEQGAEEALSAAAQGETPVVISGDGLIGHIGGALAGSGHVMGIIPGGRGNDLARVLGIASDPPSAVGVLAAGNVREIDVGEANGRRFLCIASGGIDSDANRIANEARLLKGSLVYAYAGIRALVQWKDANFTLTADGTRHTYRGCSFAVANSKAYGGGMHVAPDADLSDGMFDVVMTSGTTKLDNLRLLPKTFKGTHVESECVTIIRAAEVTVEADRPFAVYADGEHIADTPVAIRLLPRALRVLAPA